MNTKHFIDKEYACKCCGKYIENMELKLIGELIRLKFGGQVIVNSGTRCPDHNESVGGAEKSYHLTGEAGDLRSTVATPREIYDFLNELFPTCYGLGLHNTFVHVDVAIRKWRKIYAE